MYVVANRVPVAENWRDAFETRFRERAGQIEQQPGFVSMQVLKPDSAGAPYVVLTHWRDKSAFEAWVGGEDFRAAHGNPLPKAAFDGESSLERFEVLVSTEHH